MGETIRGRIIKIDWNEKKIGLSLRDVDPAAPSEGGDVPSEEPSPSPVEEPDADEPHVEEPDNDEPHVEEPNGEEPHGES
jgi:transcriptional accessory protein Tex/SPT6